jgi:hypothetical protein
MRSLEPGHLAAGAGEDRAALSGHPRKANAGQYEIVLQQRESTRNPMPQRRQHAIVSPMPTQKRKRPDVSVGARFAS